MKSLGGNSMLGKLLKNDLKKNLRWMWILFVSTIAIAALDRGCKELAENLVFFKVFAIVLDSIFYALLANTIVQPFLRGFMNFSKSLYGDESYLTHTLPVTKNQIINSKFLTALIEILLGFICLVISLLIVFASPTLFTTLKLLISTIVVGEISVFWTLFLFILLVVVEFLMFISIIYFSIVIGYRSKEKKVLKAFLFTALFSFASSSVLSMVMVIVLLINGIDLTSTVLTMSSSAFLSIFLTGIIVYICVSVLFYILTKIAFRKGVNVD